MMTRPRKKETRKKLKMKMRPLRVKVRKPAKTFQNIQQSAAVTEGEDPFFGLKSGVANSDLVSRPKIIHSVNHTNYKLTNRTTRQPNNNPTITNHHGCDD